MKLIDATGNSNKPYSCLKKGKLKKKDYKQKLRLISGLRFIINVINITTKHNKQQSLQLI